MSELRWEDPVERQIREAMERGEFENLPGAGKPLHTADQGPGWWIRRYLDRLRKLDVELDAENAKRQVSGCLVPGAGAVVGGDMDPGDSGRDHQFGP